MVLNVHNQLLLEQLKLHDKCERGMDVYKLMYFLATDINFWDDMERDREREREMKKSMWKMSSIIYEYGNYRLVITHHNKMLP